MSYPRVFTKDPDETVDFSIDWSNLMTHLSDTISSSLWTLDTGVTEAVALTSNTTTETTVGVTGGAVGNNYDVTNTIVTTGGRTFQQSFTLKVREL